jgi:hypothetical protein
MYSSINRPFLNIAIVLKIPYILFTWNTQLLKTAEEKYYIAKGSKSKKSKSASFLEQ